MNAEFTRRQLFGAVALAPAARAARGQVRLRAYDASLAPLREGALKTLLVISGDGRAFELLPQVSGDGAAAIELPNEKFEITMPLPVRDFGDLWLYADDGGALYRASPDMNELVLILLQRYSPPPGMRVPEEGMDALGAYFMNAGSLPDR